MRALVFFGEIEIVELVNATTKVAISVSPDGRWQTLSCTMTLFAPGNHPSGDTHFHHITFTVGQLAQNNLATRGNPIAESLFLMPFFTIRQNDHWLLAHTPVVHKTVRVFLPGLKMKKNGVATMTDHLFKTQIKLVDQRSPWPPHTRRPGHAS